MLESVFLTTLFKKGGNDLNWVKRKSKLKILPANNDRILQIAMRKEKNTLNATDCNDWQRTQLKRILMSSLTFPSVWVVNSFPKCTRWHLNEGKSCF